MPGLDPLAPLQAADWQLGQALAALAGRPVRSVAAPGQLMPAQPACERVAP
ncbi:hypothetical protein [Burkholderia sp. A9]|uniref:hypothetical protein n=1 Tax=Burkholderia sp. A9 TaxID=1365108 RepID=UPI0013A07E4A|nr:hypothetical protein [Burkholderia sp. A9]